MWTYLEVVLLMLLLKCSFQYIELVFILLGHSSYKFNTSFVSVTFIMHFILFLCYIVELYFVSILWPISSMVAAGQHMLSSTLLTFMSW
jgi:hypothetical protein